MFAGIASELERYENNILYLRIANTEEVWLSTQETAVKFANMWRNWNEELKHAEGYVVSFYKAESTGTVVAGNDVLRGRGLVHKKIKAMIAERKKAQKLTHIYSGVFEDEDEVTNTDKVEGYIITCGTRERKKNGQEINS